MKEKLFEKQTLGIKIAKGAAAAAGKSLRETSKDRWETSGLFESTVMACSLVPFIKALLQPACMHLVARRRAVLCETFEFVSAVTKSRY